MRIKIPAALGVTIMSMWCCLLLAVHADGAANVSKNKDANDANITAKQIHLTFKPRSISWQRTVTFDDNGKPQNNNSYLSVDFTGHYNNTVNVISYKLLSGEIVTGSGRHLKAQANGDNLNRVFANQQALSFGLSFHSPGQVKAIKKASGKVQINVGVGSIKQAVLTPIKKYLGHRVLIPNLGKNVWIKVEQDDAKTANERWKVTFSGDAYKLYDKMRFLDASGNEINSQPWGGGSNGDIDYQYYHAKVTADGQIVVRFWPREKTLTIPFEVGHIKWSTSNKDAAAALIVPAQPVPKKKANPDSQLKLHVEKSGN